MAAAYSFVTKSVLFAVELPLICFVGHAQNLIQRVGANELISNLYSGTVPLSCIHAHIGSSTFN